MTAPGMSLPHPWGVIRRPPPARATLAQADPARDGVTDGTAPTARRRPVRLDGPPPLARPGAALGRRGLRALPHGRRGRELSGLPGPDPGAGRAVRHLRGRDQRQRLRGRGRRPRVRHHERGQAVRLRPGLPGARPRGGPPAGRGQRHRDGLRLPGRGRARPRRPHQPDGERRAIATTSLAPGAGEAGWAFLQDGLSRFAGRALSLDEEVYASASATNHRNRGIANLLQSYRRLWRDPAEAVELYTRQSSLRVTVTELAVMGATLADGGVNPLTRERVVDAAVCHFTLAVMTTAGMYEASGDWLYDVGVPGKSGIGGGIVVVSPGKGGLGTFAPPLDGFGNSVKGQLAARFLARRLGLSLFVSEPET